MPGQPRQNPPRRTNPQPPTYQERQLQFTKHGYQPEVYAPKAPNYPYSYWEEPRRVARYYNALQSLPPGTQANEWLQEHQAEIEGAYEYLRQANNYGPWWTWKRPAASDPGRAFLQGIPTPPDEMLWEDERARFGAPVEPEYTPTPADQLRNPAHMNMTDEEWNALQPFQQQAISLMQSPEASGALTMGAMGLAQGGPVGAVKGGLFGGVMGAASRLKEAKSPFWAGLGGLVEKGMLALDQPAEFAERLIGTGAQVYGSIVDPESYGSFFDVLSNLPAAWQAAHLTYDVGLGSRVASFEKPGSLALPILSPLTGKWIDPANALAETQGLIPGGAGTPTLAGEGEVWGWTSPTPYAPEAGLELDALRYARDALAGGAAPEEVYADVQGQMGMSGAMREMLGHIIMDPLNIQGLINTEALKLVGKATDNKLLVAATEGQPGAIPALKTYADLTRRTMEPGTLDRIGGVHRWVLDKFGADVTREGTWKLLEPAAPKTGVAGWWERFRHLDPKSRAVELNNETVLMMEEVLTRADDARTMVQYVHSLANTPMELGSELGMQVLRSPEGAVFPMFLRDASKPADDLLVVYDATRWQAATIEKIAGVMGVPAQKVVSDINKNPETFLAAFVERARQSADPAAAKLIEAYEDGRATMHRLPPNEQLTPANLQRVVKGFTGENPAPLTLDDFKAQLFAMMKDSLDRWSADYLGVEPSGTWGRLAQTVKALQSIVLLNYNPIYLANNVLNNIVTMAAEGVFGFRTPNEIKAFWEKWGYTHPRLRAGFGPAAAGIDLETGGLVKGEGGKVKPQYPHLQEAMSDPSALGRITRAASNFSEKYGIFNRISARVEQANSAQAMTAGTQQFWRRFWRAGKGFSKMDPELAAAINSIHPGGEQAIYSLISAGMNQKEIYDALWSGMGQTRVETRIGAAVEALRKAGVEVDEGAAADMLQQTGLLDKLNQALTGATTPEAKRAAFRSADADIQKWLDTMAKDELKRRVVRVAYQAETEGIGGVLRIWDDQQLGTMEVMHQNAQGWTDTFARVDRDPDHRTTYIQAQKARSRQMYDRFWKRYEATIEGLCEGLRLDNPISRQMIADQIAHGDNWRAFYKAVDDLHDKFFTTTHANRQARDVAYQAMLDDIEDLYQKHSTEELRLQNDMDDAFAKGLADRYGPEKGAAAGAWRERMRVFRQELFGRMARHRAATREMTPPERDAAWKKFWNDEWLPLQREYLQANVDGAQALSGKPLEEAVQVPEKKVKPTQPPPKKGERETAARGIASKYGLATADEAGNKKPGSDVQALNIVKKYGGPDAAKYKRLDDVDPGVAEHAFTVWSKKKEADAAVKAGEAEFARLKAENEKLKEALGSDVFGNKVYYPGETDPAKAPYNLDVEGAPVKMYMDAAGLKYLNDTHGFEAGDALLAAYSKAAKDNGFEIYRVGKRGDEFILTFKTADDATKARAILRAEIENATIVVELPDGTRRAYTGFDGPHFGTGADLRAAGLDLDADKVRARAEGTAAGRGEQPEALRPAEEPAEGSADRGGLPAEPSREPEGARGAEPEPEHLELGDDLRDEPTPAEVKAEEEAPARQAIEELEAIEARRAEMRADLEAETPLLPMGDYRKMLREGLIGIWKYSEEEADAGVAVWDALAEAWAKEYNRSAAEYYQTHIRGVVEGGVGELYQRAGAPGTMAWDTHGDHYFSKNYELWKDTSGYKGETPDQWTKWILRKYGDPELKTFKSRVDGMEWALQDALKDYEKKGDRSIFFQSAEAPVWYSQLERAVEAFPQEKMTAEQLRGVLAKGGVKADELKWTGFDDWLAGKQRVTKAEALAFLRENRVEVREVLRGDDLESEAALWWNDEGGANEQTPFYELTAQERRDAVAEYRQAVGQYGDDATKYQTYNLPGGENYRELLFEMPVDKPQHQSLSEISHRLFGKGFDELTDDQIAKVQAEFRLAWDKNVRVDYTSPHWSEPNVLAHVRFNERVDADGKKVLFIEEVQSDWGQAGREKGFQQKYTPETLPPEYTTRYRASDNKIVLFKDNEIVQAFDNVDAAVAWVNSQGVPPMPFAKTWHELVMKRMLRWAAENGFERVAWTTGEQQAERYDLAKHFTSISAQYNKNFDTYNISGKPVGGGEALQLSGITPEELPGHVGQNLAQRIIERVKPAPDEVWYQFDGEDLKVGGEGMKGFYDEMLPRWADKYAKKWGAKTGETKVGTAFFNDAGQKFLDDIGMTAKEWDALPQAERSRIWNERGRSVSVHAIDVTPAMRESVMGGQPMFQTRKGAVSFGDDGRAVLHALTSPDISTFIHETGHIIRRDLRADDLRVAEEWAGVVDGIWKTEHEEKFARAFERYVIDGVAPVPALVQVFEKLKRWMLRIYTTITGSAVDVEVTPELRAVFDRLLGAEAQKAPEAVKPSAPAPVEPAAAPRYELTQFGQYNAYWTLEGKPTKDPYPQGGSWGATYDPKEGWVSGAYENKKGIHYYRHFHFEADTNGKVTKLTPYGKQTRLSRADYNDVVQEIERFNREFLAEVKTGQPAPEAQKVEPIVQLSPVERAQQTAPKALDLARRAFSKEFPKAIDELRTKSYTYPGRGKMDRAAFVEAVVNDPQVRLEGGFDAPYTWVDDANNQTFKATHNEAKYYEYLKEHSPEAVRKAAQRAYSLYSTALPKETTGLAASLKNIQASIDNFIAQGMDPNDMTIRELRYLIEYYSPRAELKLESIGDFDYFRWNGELYKVQTGAPRDTSGFPMGARWESSGAAADSRLAMLRAEAARVAEPEPEKIEDIPGVQVEAKPEPVVVGETPVPSYPDNYVPVLTNPRGYYISLTADGAKQMAEDGMIVIDGKWGLVKGTKVEIPGLEGIDLFAHKDSTWKITEGTTGLAIITDGRTRVEAIEKLTEIVKNRGTDAQKVRDLIDQWVKKGVLSPRYEMREAAEVKPIKPKTEKPEAYIKGDIGKWGFTKSQATQIAEAIEKWLAPLTDAQKKDLETASKYLMGKNKVTNADEPVTFNYRDTAGKAAKEHKGRVVVFGKDRHGDEVYAVVLTGVAPDRPLVLNLGDTPEGAGAQNVTFTTYEGAMRVYKLLTGRKPKGFERYGKEIYFQSSDWFPTETGPKRTLTPGARTDTPEFRQWFGGSKVVDENGAPLRVYHGTKADFDTFATTGKVSRQTVDPNRFLGTHFTESSYVAEIFTTDRYTKGFEGGNIIPVYLSIQKPMVFSLEPDLNSAMAKFGYETGLVTIDDIQRTHSMDAYEIVRDIKSGEYETKAKEQSLYWYGIGTSIMKSSRKRAIIAKNFKKYLQSQGYDGIKYGNTVEGLFGNPTWIAFEPEQIKSTFNRGTWDDSPRILYQDADGTVKEARNDGAPPEPVGKLGAADELDVDPPIAEMAEQGYYTHVEPLVKALEEAVVNDPEALPQGIRGFQEQIDPVSMRALKKYIANVQGQMSDVKLAALKHGEMRRDASLLNYSRRYGFDNVLGMFFPYEFWYTRSALQWALRSIDKPGYLAAWAKLRNIQERTQNSKGFPTRLKNKGRIPFPFLPEWMGGGVYVDPLRQLFPFEQFARPWQRLEESENMLARRAAFILQGWAEDETEDPAEAEQALATRSGALWEQAYAQAKLEIEGEVANPMDFVSLLMSPSLPIQAGYYALSGQKERIAPLPVSRFVTAVTSTLGANKGRGWNIEEPFRKALGMPLLGQFEDYQVDRMLANMTAEGECLPDQAVRAMIDRQGPLFEEAQKRAQQVRNVQYWGGALAADVFPEGEQEQRALYEEYQKAIEAWSAGDDTAMRAFYDAYPEYEARSAINKEPEERLRSYLVGEVWDRYFALPDLRKQEVNDQMGEAWDLFLNPETRSVESVETDTLASWARTLGMGQDEELSTLQGASAIPLEQAPEADVQAYQTYTAEQERLFPGIGSVLSVYYGLPEGRARDAFERKHPEIGEYNRWKAQHFAANPNVIGYAIGEENKVYGESKDIQALYYKYQAERDRQFPGVFDLQDQYFSRPAGDWRREFLAENPELTDYWDWRNEFMRRYPNMIPYLMSEESIAEKVLGEDYQAQAAMEEPPFLRAFEQINSNPALSRAFQQHVLLGQPLGAGARSMLKLVWEQEGEPGTFDEWVEVLRSVASGE